MAKKPKFGETEIGKIVSMYDGKTSVKEIAKTMGTTVATVTSYLKKKGVYKGRARKPGKNAGRLTKTLSIEAISDRLDAARAQVKQLEKLLGKTVEREELKFKKMKEKIGIK